MNFRLVTILFIVLLSLGVRADFNDGVVALTMGNYDKAMSMFVPLAETTDHAYAQYFVGRMYAAGQGVEKNLKTAAKWYRKASEQGVGDAQYRLGVLYENGDGVPRDLEYAYSWYAVAAHLGNAKAIAALAQTADLLSAAEMEEARTLAAELIEKYGKTPKTTARTQ